MRKEQIFAIVGLPIVMLSVLSCNKENQHKESEDSEPKTILISLPNEDQNLSSKEAKDSKNNYYELSEKRQALNAAQRVVKSEFSTNSTFHPDGTIIEETQVPGRYKILQEFECKPDYSNNLVYRIWVQNFEGTWEYGNLGIEERGTGRRLFSKNGNMKQREQENISKQETIRDSGIEHTIIKRNIPNYVVIYTPQRLSKSQLKELYNKYKDEYQIIQFTKSSNPDDDEYLAIQYGMVYDHDKNQVVKLSEW